MAENSKIEWTDHTFNPWIGCTKVSDGCKNCYAEAMWDKRYGRVKWGVNGKRVRTSAANWNKPLAWNRKAEKEGKRARVFCASLADVFEDKPDQPEMDEWRRDLFEMILATPCLDWLLLTKRPENIIGMASKHVFAQGLPSNVWIGTSVENQEQADKRIPELLEIPAAIRFLSMEPLLGKVELSMIDGVFYDGDMPFPWQRLENPGVNWVIVGGESGPNARPMNPDWVRQIQVECQLAGVPFLFKQWGEWVPACQKFNWEKSHTPHRRVLQGDEYYKVGKHVAGRLLDGQEWNEFPR